MAPPLPRPASSMTYRVCFVCTGNICRSPMAEVVLRQLAAGERLSDGGTLGDRLTITSAGTGSWHEGEPMDGRARDALAAAGFEDHGHVAHQFAPQRFDDLDLVVALDRGHLDALRRLDRSEGSDGRLRLLRSFDAHSGGALDVPDPYYGDAGDFTRCLDLVVAGCRGLVPGLRGALTAAPAGAPED